MGWTLTEAANGMIGEQGSVALVASQTQAQHVNYREDKRDGI